MEKVPSGDPGYDYKVETKEVLSEEVTFRPTSDSTSTYGRFLNGDIIDYDTISVNIDGQIYTCEKHVYEDSYGKFIVYGSQPTLDEGEWIGDPNYLDYPFSITSYENGTRAYNAINTPL